MSTPSEQTEAIVDAALDLPPAERAAYLDRACGADAALRQSVEALLRAHQLAPAPRAAATPLSPTSEQPGDRIGLYKLLQRLGEGGCGVVYMAEQEEPVRRRVALKLIKLGMDTKQVIARFEAERQALALMDHPNIAKVLEAGASDTGRPYFVMELVRGTKITEYCDRNNLPTQQRLELFMQVSKAVQHAHQKGIIHRDLKPSNILVTLHDGVPVPKVIDFGIAKAIEQNLTDKTVFTALEQFIGTPAYMSPEQAEMSGLDIDTRSDIYSLGVLLYELLTSRIPFDSKDLVAAGLEQMRKIIREQDPVRPSTKLSTLTAAEQTTIAKQRQVEAPKLIHLVRGDLDWIVMKCLEKDRTRRYETANGLAMDIERHLNSEPVVACPPSRVYRFRKMVRRNKFTVIAIGSVTAALLLGLGIASWMFFKERRARQRAVAAERKSTIDATKSKQVAEFLKAMLESVGPSVALGRDTTLLREILDKTAERVSRDLADQPEVEVELRLVLAETYEGLALFEQMEAMARLGLSVAQTRLADNQRLIAEASSRLAGAMWHQGKLDKAEALFLESLAIYIRMEGSEGPGLAGVLANLGLVLERQGRLDEAEARGREALAMNTKLHGDASRETFMSLTFLTVILAGERKVQEAELMQRRALEVGRKVLGNENADVVTGLNNLAVILKMQGKEAEAAGMFREVLLIYRKLYGAEHPDIAVVLQNLGGCLCNQGKPDEAEPLHRDALRMRRKTLGEDHPEVASALESLGVTLSMQGKLTEGEDLLRQALGLNQKHFGEKHLLVANSLQNLGRTLRQADKLAESESAHRKSLAIRKQLLGDENPDVANSIGDLASVLHAQRKLPEAEEMCRKALVMQRKLFGDEDIRVATTLNNLCSMLRGQGKLVEVEPLLRECLAILEKRLPDGWQTFSTRSLLGASLLAQKKYEEARSFLLTGYEGMQQRLAKNPAARPRVNETLKHLVELHEATGEAANAAQWKSKLAEFENIENPQ